MGATWTQQTSLYPFTSGSGHSLVALPGGDIIVMGGMWGTPLNEVWRSADKGQTWTAQTTAARWTARERSSAVAMPYESIILMGGNLYWGGNNYANDVWRSTDKGVSWTLVNASAGWSKRHSSSSVVLPDGSIILTGGYYNNDVWRLQPAGSSDGFASTA